MFSFLAQNLKPINLGNIRGEGPLGLENEKFEEAPTLFTDTLSRIIGAMTAGAIIWFVFQFIIGAYGWLSAGGDAKAVEQARGRIANSVIGMILVLAAVALISLLGFLLDIDILNLGNFIDVLTPKSKTP